MGIEDYQFEKGREKTGGRAKGTRNKISEAFLKDLHAEWERSGPDTLKILAKEDPASFAKLALGTLPKEFSGETGITVRTIVTGVVRTGDDATTAALPATEGERTRSSGMSDHRRGYGCRVAESS